MAHFRAKLKNEKEKLTNEDIANILTYTDKSDTKVDGQIGSFKQGRVGDCWYLSMLKNYAATSAGVKNIQDRIRNNHDGSYTVTFQNPIDGKNIEYKITETDLKLNPKIIKGDLEINLEIPTFSSGDKDVRIFEIATNRLLKDFAGSEISEGFPLKRAIVHKAMGYTEPLVIYQKNLKAQEDLKNGANWAYTFDKELYNKNRNTEIFKITLGTRIENGKLVLTPKVETTTYPHFVAILKEHKAENLTCGSGSEYMGSNPRENRYLSAGHVYNIEKIKKDNEDEITDIVISDPYNSQFLHPVSNELFKNDKITTLQFTPINN